MKTTNNHWREVIYQSPEDCPHCGEGLPYSIVQTCPDCEQDIDQEPGFMYKGAFYSLGTCMRTESGEFDGVIGLTNTSALGVKVSPCGDSVQVTLLT